jgi:hypothetical protein
MEQASLGKRGAMGKEECTVKEENVVVLVRWGQGPTGPRCTRNSGEKRGAVAILGLKHGEDGHKGCPGNSEKVVKGMMDRGPTGGPIGHQGYWFNRRFWVQLVQKRYSWRHRFSRTTTYWSYCHTRSRRSKRIRVQQVIQVQFLVLVVWPLGPEGPKGDTGSIGDPKFLVLLVTSRQLWRSKRWYRFNRWSKYSSWSYWWYWSRRSGRYGFNRWSKYSSWSYWSRRSRWYGSIGDPSTVPGPTGDFLVQKVQKAIQVQWGQKVILGQQEVYFPLVILWINMGRGAAKWQSNSIGPGNSTVSSRTLYTFGNISK